MVLFGIEIGLEIYMRFEIICKMFEGVRFFILVYLLVCLFNWFRNESYW